MSVITEMTRGSAVARAPLALAGLAGLSLAAALVVALTRPEEWLGWWPTTVGITEQGAVWISMVACGYAAWIAGQARAHGFLEWSSASPRDEASRVMPALRIVAVVTIGAQLASVGIILGISWAYGLDASASDIDLVLLVPTTTAYLIVWICVGAFLGRHTSRTLALPISGLLPYVVYAATAVYASEGPLAAFAVSDGRVYDYVRPSPEFVVARAAFWVLAAAASWLTLTRSERLQRAALWGSSVAAAVVVFQGLVIVPIPGATAPVCAGSRPQTCLDRSHAGVMPIYRDELARLWPAVPSALRADVIGSDASVLAGRSGRRLVLPPVSGSSEPARLVERTFFAARMGNALFSESCRQDDPGMDSAVALVIWWRTMQRVPMDGTAFVGDADYVSLVPGFDGLREQAVDFAELSPSRREAWFDRHAAAIGNCSAPSLTSA